MFTGIIEITVPISLVELAGPNKRLTLPCPWQDAAAGQSIAVNGCCLTISSIHGGQMSFDVVPETLEHTHLGQLNAGEWVQLEQSLKAGDRLDGHIVQGHIDGVAPLLAKQDDGEGCRLTIATPPNMKDFIVAKGSVAVDGVSLTIAAARTDAFETALIPTTLERTALGKRPVGWMFNLESDILARTVVAWLERRTNGK